MQKQSIQNIIFFYVFLHVLDFSLSYIRYATYATVLGETLVWYIYIFYIIFG